MNLDQNIIFIIVAAVIGISRLVARIAENAREKSQRTKREAEKRPRTQPPVITRRKSDEERVREFLEALGQPTTAPPPPKVQPRTDIPARPVAPIAPPPLGRPFSPFPVKPLMREVRKVISPPPVAPDPSASAGPEANEPGAWMRDEEKVQAAAAKFDAATRPATASPAITAARPGEMWRNALHSPSSARAAIVLREILGPPRALANLESI